MAAQKANLRKTKITVDYMPKASDNQALQQYVDLINANIGVEHDGYTEGHHIKPRSFFRKEASKQTVDRDNLIDLKARDHFMAHVCLFNAYLSTSRSSSMASAITLMADSKNSIYELTEEDALVYEEAKIIKSKAMSARLKGNKNTLGFIHSEETKRKMSRTHIGRKHSEESLAKMSKAQTGKKLTAETRAKIGASNKGKTAGRKRPTMTCPHCGVTGAAHAMKRWHFDNCGKPNTFSDNATAKMRARMKGNTINVGRKHTEQARANMKAAQQGKVVSEETKAKLSAAHKGKTISAEHRAKIGAAHKGMKRKPQATIQCPHCGKTGQQGAMKQWHFDNCSMNPDSKSDRRSKQSEKAKKINFEIVRCPHCDKEGHESIMKRWHFDNCKHKAA